MMQNIFLIGFMGAGKSTIAKELVKSGAEVLAVDMDENKKRHMTSYVHDIGRCMYCDLCIEACNFKALKWDQNYEAATYFKEDLIYDAVEEAKNRRDGNE